MPPSATAPASANPAPSPAATSVPRLTLASADFRSGGRIPVRFTCDGRDVSPSLSWTGVPTGTRRLALIVDDPDANHFIHWIAYAIDPEAARLGEGAGAANSALRQGTNDFGRVGYGGPCPPSGTHRYVFTLYALAGPLGLDGNPRGAAVRAALAGAVVLAKATLTATYAR
jgi:Raf kinase inhibitor-like YbhB/YbcL family protein